MQQLNVVICGFDHYENIDVNPSYEVPEALVRDGIGEPSDVDDPLHDANVSINTVALPVSFANAWPTLLETLDATRPDIVIATGLKHAAHSVAMERCATNLMNAARPDADNALPRFEPIIKDGPAAYWTRLPLRAIINDFARDGIPATFRRGHVRMQFAVLPAAALDGDTGSCAGRLRQLPSDQWRQQAAERPGSAPAGACRARCGARDGPLLSAAVVRGYSHRLTFCWDAAGFLPACVYVRVWFVAFLAWA